MKLFDLSGKSAIVTGATRGLGRGMAVALAEAGANIVGLGTSGCGETEKEVEAAGGKFLEIKADLSSLDPVQAIIDKSIETFGGVDILVNNAGTIRRDAAVDFTEKDWDDVMNVNLKTLFFLSQAVAKHFIETGKKGKIINIASMLSFQGGIRVPSYTASKSGVMGLTRLMACEWGPKGINCNGIAPGYMATDNTQALQDDPVRNQQILDRIPQGRWGTPQDLAGAIIFLASSASDYVNGYTIAVDGGWLAR